MNVGQLMKRAVMACGADDTLNAAAQVMWDHDCGCVPVVDADKKVIGMITDRDICMAAYTQGGALRSLLVSSAMAKNVFVCKPTDSISYAERVMRDHQIHRLPVVDETGQLAGIISLNDIASEAGHEASARKRDISLAEVGETLAAVCKTRASELIASAA